MILPYEGLFGSIDLEVIAVEIDGHPAPGTAIDNARSCIPLAESGRPEWTDVVVHLAMVAPDGEAADLADPRAVVSVECAATNVRDASPLQRSDVQPGRWVGEVRLTRAQMAERVTIVGTIAATVDAVPFRKVATTRSWVVDVDPVSAIPNGGSLEIRWESFTAIRDRLPPSALDQTFHVDLEAEPPVVLLNKDVEGLQELLGEEAPQPTSHRLVRNGEIRRIATSAWAGMFSVAVADIDWDDGEGGTAWPESEWQRAVLTTLLPAVYACGADEALVRAGEALRGGGLRGLHSAAGSAIAHHLGLRGKIGADLTTLERTGGER